jgi:restriction endonuclease S subunit
MKIQSISTVLSGYFTTTIQKGGEIYYIQARDFDSNKKLIPTLQKLISREKKSENHYLKKGDILVLAKGVNFHAYIYDESFAPAIASTAFLIIRINDKNHILPEFLAWYINQPQTQSNLKLNGKGTRFPAINKAILSELEIPSVTIEKQQKIIEIDHLREKEKQLINKIQTIKDLQLNKILLNFLQ